ncbi:MBL fold metallo-hydrolase [Fibrella sp. HMF5335]|uniref:MBL fold metallo-hydrolase n=1 Tax=Fibrella rubiginis TaxID=2817060 RepID=A0A939K2J9_9BACT|nr:MBL fold metallo-hydrolase [Fibrella rubiginis]MBO0938287.1 MBL fold metallo-hydrolase [Fibrella rubiginis]
MQQITPSLYQISLGAVNVFVIKDNGLTLVDTGYTGSMDKIFAAIRKGGEQPEAIKQIILTHAHPDHAGSAASIKNKLGIPLLAHTQDAVLVEQGVGGRSPRILSPDIINWLIFNLFIKNISNTIEAVSVDQLLHHSEVLPLAGGLQVLHTPGHSAGHIALLLHKEGVLIAGDLCANVAGLGLSPVYEDRDLGIESILAVSELDFDKAVFGHGRLLKGQANHKLKDTFTAVRDKLM